MPLSHLTLTVSHLPTSTSFFLSCLQPLGYQFIGRHDDYIGFGQKSGEPADFWITEQKPGSPAGAAHVAFPAPSKDAVGAFFISALKAGGKIHGEPKTRDSDSGYYSAAIVDFDGNSIEAVYRPIPSAARSEVSVSTMALLESGPKASTKASSVAPPSIAPSYRSDAKSYVSKAITAVERSIPWEPEARSERGAPSIISREIQQVPSPTYVVHHTTHTTQKTDDSTTAKTIVGTLIGAAAGAAIAYAISKSDTQSSPSSEATSPPQYSARDIAQLLTSSQAPSQAPSQAQEHQVYRAIEAPPARSIYSQSEVRSTLSRSVSSKNPHASTIYEGTEYVSPQGENRSVYLDEHGRRASEGSVYSTRDMPLRAIEYPPPARSGTFPCDASTLISSFPDRSRVTDKESVYSSSTVKASKANYQEDHHSSSHSSHHSSRHSSHHSVSRSQTGNSTASSTRSARNIPLPEGSVASYASYRSATKSGVSGRDIPLPESVIDDLDVESIITPDDSISQVDFSKRSTHSHQSHRSKAPSSHVSKRSSKFDEPVKPSDSVSQVSSNISKTSQRTVKASGSTAPSKTASKVSSRRG